MPNPQEDHTRKNLEFLSTRLETVDRRIAKNNHMIKRHVEAGAKAGAKGNEEKLSKHRDLADSYARRLPALQARQRRIKATMASLRHNASTAAKLTLEAARLAAPAKALAQAQQEQAASEAATLAAMAPREARQHLRALEHEANRKEKAIRQKRQRFIAAGIEPDERLANAHRDIEVAGIGKDTKAYVSGIASVLRNKADRLPARIQAWDRFDRVCDAACCGLIGSPKYDVAVQGSTNPEIPSSRIEAGDEMTKLARSIGWDGWGLLYAIVYERRSFVEMSGEGEADGGRQAVAARFRAALDGAASFWGLGDYAAMPRMARRILIHFDEEAREARRYG